MIGRIAGLLVYSQPPQLLIDCNGVGYEIEAPLPVFFGLPALGEKVVLSIHMVVREDAQLLYGFSTVAQRSLFRELIKVNGVGPKMAIAILSSLSAEEFALSIANHDVAALTRLPGIGKKTAERLIVEMQDRIGKLSLEGGVVTPSSAGGPVTNSDRTQAIEALEALGYKNTEAQRMVKGAAGESVEEIIKVALKRAAP
ncbi:Holliday junction DNA helicase RuvA [Chromatiales bacterium (ex Bugula neritina AB1)]|nr:Holliday junction DNA helicase RuvA [Chromatiales bacterium (ex Bugula neritina AB1)]